MEESLYSILKPFIPWAIILSVIFSVLAFYFFGFKGGIGVILISVLLLVAAIIWGIFENKAYSPTPVGIYPRMSKDLAEEMEQARQRCYEQFKGNPLYEDSASSAMAYKTCVQHVNDVYAQDLERASTEEDTGKQSGSVGKSFVLFPLAIILVFAMVYIAGKFILQ